MDTFVPSRGMADDLAKYLEDQIVFLEIEPGARLVEEEISTRLGVSRSPVREALRTLQANGLVERSPHRGYWVVELSLDRANDLYSCRIPLESLAAQLAAENAKPSDVRELTRAYEAMKSARKDVRQYFMAAAEFTQTTRKIARNQVLTRILDGLDKQVRRYRYLAFSRIPNHVDEALVGNQDILTAIGRNNATAAGRAAERLIKRSWTLVIRDLRKQTLLAGNKASA
jgi:DNA-binding GntR family transcriptional regulator